MHTHGMKRWVVHWIGGTDLDPFRYHRIIEYCPYRDCTHFSFIRFLVKQYSRVVTPTGYEPLFTRVRPYRIVLRVIASTIVDAKQFSFHDSLKLQT
jgi:hypothetical protein